MRRKLHDSAVVTGAINAALRHLRNKHGRLIGGTSERKDEADRIEGLLVEALIANERRNYTDRGLRRAVKVLAYRRWYGDYHCYGTDRELALVKLLEPEVEQIVEAGKRGDYRKRPF